MLAGAVVGANSAIQGNPRVSLGEILPEEAPRTFASLTAARNVSNPASRPVAIGQPVNSLDPPSKSRRRLLGTGLIVATGVALGADTLPLQKKVANSANFTSLRETDPSKYEKEIKELVERVYFEYFLYSKNSPSNLKKTLMNLVRSMDEDGEGIFESIDRDGKNLGEDLVSYLINCSAKSKLSYKSLREQVLQDLRGAISYEHAFNIVPLTNGRYLITDFTWGIIRALELEGEKSYYEKKGGYYV